MKAPAHARRPEVVITLLLAAAAASCSWFSSNPVVPDDARDVDGGPAEATGEEEGNDPEEDALEAPDDIPTETPEQITDDIPGEDAGDVTPPSVPSGLTATPYSHYAIDLSWDLSTDDVGVTGYIITRNGSGVQDTTETSCRDQGLTPGSAYIYRVAARDAAGNISAPSSQALATAPAITVRYEILKAAEPVTVDGDVSEFSTADTMTLIPPEGGNIARVKALWDAEALYVSYEVTDSQLNAIETVPDGDVWSDDAAEIFVDVNNDSAGFNVPIDACMLTDDFQIIVNILNVHTDSRGSESGEPSDLWDGDYESAVIVTGTIGNNADIDGGFTLEIGIPWTALAITAPPADGTIMGIAFTHEDMDESTFSYVMWPDITESPFRNASRWPDVLLSPDYAPW